MGSRAKRRRNPSLAVLNPPPRGKLIGRGVQEVAYTRHHRRGTGGAAGWVHKYRTGDVDARGLPDGRVVLASRAGKPLWSGDRERWLDNPARRRRNEAEPGDWGGKDFSLGKYKTVAQLKRAAETLIDHVHPGSVMAAAARSAIRSPDYFLARPEHQAELADMIRRYVSPERKGKFRKNKGGAVSHRRKNRSTKRRRASGGKRKPPRGFKSWSAYMASIRPKSGRKPGPKRAKTRRPAMSRKRRKSRRRSNPPRASFRRRRSSQRRRGGRRHLRRNPPMRGIIGTLIDGVKGGAGVVAGKAISRAVPALIGIQPQGYLGLAVQAGVGVGAYMLADRFVGRENARNVLYGAFGGVIESAIRGWNIPVLSPALGDETELHAIAGYVHGYLPAGTDGAKSNNRGLGDGEMADDVMTMG